jgi:adenylate cyclase
VTGAVQSRLRDRFHLVERGVVDIKGKGPTTTYFLVGEAAAESAPAPA